MNIIQCYTDASSSFEDKNIGISCYISSDHIDDVYYSRIVVDDLVNFTGGDTKMLHSIKLHEMVSIYLCLKMILEYGFRNQDITIYSDSENALQQILIGDVSRKNSNIPYKEITKSIRILANNIRRNDNTLSYMHVGRDSGVYGNIIADSFSLNSRYKCDDVDLCLNSCIKIDGRLKTFGNEYFGYTAMDKYEEVVFNYV